MAQVEHVLVTQAEAGQKLINFLRRRLKAAVPQSALMRWIRTGQVRVDGRRAKPFLRLAENMTVRIPPYQPGVTESVSIQKDVVSGPPLEVVFESRDLLVVAKPPGLPVHGGSKHEVSLHSLLADRFPDASFAPTPAHRLDKDTSGLVLVALSYACLARLHECMRERLATKIYLAWVHGMLPLSRLLPLRDEMEKGGAPGRERVAIRLITGRTHQIRVQLATRGHAVVGDRKYGPALSGKGDPGRLLLHAWRIVLPGESYSLAPDWPEPYAVGEDAEGLGLFDQPF